MYILLTESSLTTPWVVYSLSCVYAVGHLFFASEVCAAQTLTSFHGTEF